MKWWKKNEVEEKKEKGRGEGLPYISLVEEE
jgi:hypothetical protein